MNIAAILGTGQGFDNMKARLYIYYFKGGVGINGIARSSVVDHLFLLMGHLPRVVETLVAYCVESPQFTDHLQNSDIQDFVIILQSLENNAEEKPINVCVAA